MLELAVSEAAESAFGSPPWTMYGAGKEKGSIFDALEDLDYQACVDRCVAISKA